MTGTGRSPLASPSVAQLLLVSLMPMLLYVGHWQLPGSIPIPGTSYALGAGTGPGHSGHDHGDHGSHCHGDSTGCSQAPIAPQAPAAHLQELAAFLGLLSMAFLAMVSAWRPAHEAGIAPELQPPRNSLAPA